jgi:mannose-6-phosphate isomerase-like protein (cupin superfamily)
MSFADKTRNLSLTSARVSNTRAYPGGLVSFLVSSAESDDHFSLFEARMQPGNEPPLHLHEERDVVFYVLEGAMEVYCGTEVHTAKAGDAVFVPRLIPHTYRIQSPTVRFLALMQPSKGIDGYFEGLSQPVESMDAPMSPTQSSPPDHAFLLALAAQHGVRFLTLLEAEAALPSDPKPRSVPLG